MASRVMQVTFSSSVLFLGAVGQYVAHPGSTSTGKHNGSATYHKGATVNGEVITETTQKQPAATELATQVQTINQPIQDPNDKPTETINQPPQEWLQKHCPTVRWQQLLAGGAKEKKPSCVLWKNCASYVCEPVEGAADCDKCEDTKKLFKFFESTPPPAAAAAGEKTNAGGSSSCPTPRVRWERVSPEAGAKVKCILWKDCNSFHCEPEGGKCDQCKEGRPFSFDDAAAMVKGGKTNDKNDIILTGVTHGDLTTDGKNVVNTDTHIGDVSQRISEVEGSYSENESNLKNFFDQDEANSVFAFGDGYKVLRYLSKLMAVTQLFSL